MAGIPPKYDTESLLVSAQTVPVGATITISVIVHDYLEPKWWYSGDVQSNEV